MPEVVKTAEFVETKFVSFFHENPLELQGGGFLSPVTVAYETYGKLNALGTNAILVCHALTANAHAAGYHQGEPQPGWWDGLIGPGKALDTDRFFVVCPNILGSCYGTTGPSSMNPKTGRPYCADFPAITVRDIVRVQKELLDFLRVQKLATVIGSSLGGMQVLEWAIMYPEFCETIIPISTSARQSAWCIGLNAAARAAIMGDPQWDNGNYDEQPETGLSVARMIGMLSYRSPDELKERFGRKQKNEDGGYFDDKNIFQVESYLRHQGKKLAERFDANTYLVLSRAMDWHDVTFGRGDLASVLGKISLPVLAIGVSSDIRYPIIEQKELVQFIPNARYAEINSIHGHDAFLIEFDQLNNMISEFFTTSIRGRL
ncbi:MAG: homoserine O-acetyltransferase [Ignavibacteriales bacterium]|nr:homoserine O-acetyltransferase [Ignavibacteriales bacterium]